MKFMQIKPQKARGVFKETMWTDPAWSCENKFDGDRRIAQFDGVGRVRFTGIRESVDDTGFVEKTDRIPHLSDPLSKLFRDQESNRLYKAVERLNGAVLDGEIVAPWAAKLPGGESKFVTSVMGSSPEKAIDLQKRHGWLEYMVFDCLYFRGMDIRGDALADRRYYLSEALKIWDNRYAKIVYGYTKESEKRRAWEQAREGLVFKHEDHLYGDERLWVKLKKEFTADVVCIGFEDGKGKYAGSVGAIIFGQWVGKTLTRMGTCRGFTDSQMNRLSREPKKYLGRVMQITHNGREPTGAFRHPRFAWRWRDDKSPKSCVYREDET